ncbi:trigger factor [Patescibacteria group bacterium]|nr:trigger factor [Patescibacteria group bacterium]
MKHQIKKLPASQIEIEVEIPSEDLDKFLEKAFAHFNEHLKVDGFRQGNIPKNIVEEKVGKENILAEAADLAVKDAYAKIIKENNLEPITAPDVQVLKLAKGNPFIFKIKVNLLPEIGLGDYNKIASQVKKNKISVSEEEINNSLEYIRKSRSKFSQLDRPAQEKDFIEIEYESSQLGSEKMKDQFILGEGGFMPGFEQKIVGMKTGEEKEFSVAFPQNAQRKDLAGKEVSFKTKMLGVKKVEIPEANDDFVKSLGKFESLSALRDNLKEGITMEKEEQERENRRKEILEKIVEKSKIDIPQSLIDSEKENLLKNFKNRISQNHKISFEEYLASVKQDEKTILESFVKEAEKKIKNYLILKEIGKRENILISEEEIEKEVNKNIKNYSKEVLEKIDINEFKEYIKGVIYNEKIFQLLENLLKP